MNVMAITAINAVNSKPSPPIPVEREKGTSDIFRSAFALRILFHSEESFSCVSPSGFTIDPV